MADLSNYDINDPRAPWNKGDYLQFNDPLSRKQFWALGNQGLQNNPATTVDKTANDKKILANAVTNTNAIRDQIYATIPQPQADQTQTDQTTAEDPYLAALYSIMNTNTANTSGYDAALKNINSQRKQVAKRYQTYTAQLSDLFGNLGRKSTTYAQEQAAISDYSNISRAQVAAQQAQQISATRSADAKRLQAANEARLAAGLGADSIAGVGGDYATKQAEAGITDQQTAGQTTIDTILANEALAKLMSSNQAAGFDIAGAQAKQQLNMSYEDMLASLANQESQTQIQKSQAISAGSISPSEQVSILQAAKNYTDAQANTGTAGTDPATIWMTANPNSAANAQRLLATFVPWFTTKAPSVDPNTGKTPTLSQLVNAYAKDHPKGAEIIGQDPTLYNLIQVYTNIK
jgi:hypothetical protein